MFRRFARVCGQLPGIENRVIDKDYGEEKAAAVDYQVSFASFSIFHEFQAIYFKNAKRELIAAFQREELGNWLKKPIEQDQFPLLSTEKWLVLAVILFRILLSRFLFLFLTKQAFNYNGPKGSNFSDSARLYNKISTESGVHKNKNNNYDPSIPMILALERYLLE